VLHNKTSMITKEDILTTDKYLSLESPTIAYIKTDVVYNGGGPIRWRGKQHGLKAAPIWITGHSDYGITQTMHETYSKYTTQWFTINKEFNHPNLHSLPLGITNDCNDTHVHPILGNLDAMIEVMNMPREIKNTVYMNFSINTYPAERSLVFNLFKDKSWVTQEPFVLTYKGRKMFLQNIRNHRFVLCPRGNGVDTHRFWETLYMGSIPITVRHIAMEEFQDLPVCWINSWDEVTEPFLEAEYKRISEGLWNMEKLKFSYWRNKICSQ